MRDKKAFLSWMTDPTSVRKLQSEHQIWSSQRSVNHKLRSIDLSLIFTAWCKAQVAKQLVKDKIYKILSDGTLKTAYRRINHRDMICQTSKPNNSEELIDKQRKKM